MPSSEVSQPNSEGPDPALRPETGDTTQFSVPGAWDDTGPTARLTAEHEDAIAALPPGSALLIVHQGPQAGARFLLDTPVTTAGRHPERDIFLDDATVSRKHAVFIRDELGFSVRDEGSLNGTYLNGRTVDSASLVAGDEIRIGKYRLTYHPSRRGMQLP
jgi:pSer/pThr/pTyr-binding forkhead associated (FHA) protein